MGDKENVALLCEGRRGLKSLEEKTILGLQAFLLREAVTWQRSKSQGEKRRSPWWVAANIHWLICRLLKREGVLFCVERWKKSWASDAWSERSHIHEGRTKETKRLWSYIGLSGLDAGTTHTVTLNRCSPPRYSSRHPVNEDQASTRRLCSYTCRWCAGETSHGGTLQ